MVTISIKYYIYHNYPLTVTCWVTFEEAVPLEMVEIEWLNADGSELKPDVISDRIQISQINQINGSRYSRDINFNPLRYKDSGMYICGARMKGKSIISRSVYQSYHLNIHCKYTEVVSIPGLIFWGEGGGGRGMGGSSSQNFWMNL